MLFLAALFVVGVISGATAAVIGFGIGSLLTPFLLTRFDPTLAVAFVALPHLIATAIRFLQHRPAIDRRVILRFGMPSAVGGVAGAWLQNAVNDAWLFAVLGILLLATAVANLTSGFGGWKPPASVAAALGLRSGLFGGLVGNQGGLRAAGLLAFDLGPRAYLATSTAVALLIDAARRPVYLARAGSGLLPHVTPIAIASVGCILGTLLGEKAFLGLAPERYRKVVATAVGLLGIWLITRLIAVHLR